MTSIFKGGHKIRDVSVDIFKGGHIIRVVIKLS